MKLLRELSGLREHGKPITVAAGFFDGVHCGHRSVIEYAKDSARKHGGEAWILTFDQHPLKVVRPEIAPLMLTSTEHKVALLETCGVDGCILLPFTHEFATTPATEFAAWLLHCAPTLSEVVVGENWRFGADAGGTPALLRELGGEAGLTVTTLPPVVADGDTISSTRIRMEIMKGNLDHAAAMLGRPVSVLGTVVHGRAIGRTLGFPSANIDPHNEALPPLGVYAVQALVNNRFYDGVMNFGTRPTFDKEKTRTAILELHLLDFEGSIYDDSIEAYFIQQLRDEWYFATINELTDQITKDVEDAREILKSGGLSAETRTALAQAWHR
ncbi:MAG: bifunctional riboflavin kinase/FAD synthetase [Verrucomicrobia bacterium]|jgi:riboflavin kinase / FMN adenylyltransferase|nr:bifunctional riboflavin kinase/FAD synthetase [Verrucomicrobiota bacterium]